MNSVVLIGNLASDVEMREVGDGRRVASFRLAVQRRFSNKQGEREADFFPIVVWGKAAEACARYLAKGKKAGVGGRLQVRSYQGRTARRGMSPKLSPSRWSFCRRRSRRAGEAPRRMDLRNTTMSCHFRRSGGNGEKLRDV